MNKESLIKLSKCIGVITLIICVILVFIIAFDDKAAKKATINIELDSSQSSGYDYTDITYNKNFFTYTAPPIDDKQVYNNTEQYDYPDEYVPVVNCVINPSYSTVSKMANETLYSLCEQYFECQDVTFLMPMVIANNESAIRADNNITFTSLFPSKVFDIENMSTITTFNCTRCVESAEVFSVMGADWWTRDRGPLQMNPDYGVHNDKYNKQMGKSEHAQLAKITINNELTAYTSKEGIITSSYWFEQSSTNAGDRFNIQDICLRLSSEYNYALETMSSVYTPDNALLKMVMLSMYHGTGSLWMPPYTDKSIGYWNSGKLAYEYAQVLSSNEVYNIIYDKAKSDVSYARKSGNNPPIGISVNEAFDIYKELRTKGYVKEVNYYTSDGSYRTDYIVYPIKAIYNYAQLSILYNGG